MATKKPDQFDKVNWDDVTSSNQFAISTNLKLLLTAAIPMALVSVFKWQAVGERENTFAVLAETVGLSSVYDTIGIEFDPTYLDLMFLFTIVLFGTHVVLPMFQSPRMAKYYYRRFIQNRPAVVSLVWLAFVFVGGIIGPFFIQQPSQDILHALQPPVGMTIDMQSVPQCLGTVENGMCHGTWEHPLGTTRGGKGVLAGVVHGMTISMKIAFITTTVVAAFGITFGTVSAFAGGWVDETMMRFTDIILSFPTFIMFLLILYIFGASLAMFIFIFSLFAWGGMARYVRSKALSVSEEEFIKATRISGASRFTIVRRHVIPNTASSIVTQLTLSVPGFLLAEAQLAFLGLGDPTLPSWGTLISSGRDYLDLAPWITVVPGFVLFLTILAFNFVGDAVLDAINPEAQTESEG
jgi:peptide/nickel transport system permease protein